MQDRFVPIKDFPKYWISIDGRVIARACQRQIARSFNERGIPFVMLWKEGKQHSRSIPLLVARAWLIPPQWRHFDTPVHLDGNRWNCHADNLVWRPRWFAVKYNQERRDCPLPEWEDLIQCIETREVFASPCSAAEDYGYLERDIVKSIEKGKPVFPDYRHFRLFS